VLLAARAVQRFGGALVFPATLSLVNTTFAEGRERNQALSVWGGAGAAGLVVGVLLGGVLTQALGWESVFFVNVPLAGSALLLAFMLIAGDPECEMNRRFDLPGALAATMGVTLLVFALVQGPTVGWRSSGIVASSALSVFFIGAFGFIERASRDPSSRRGCWPIAGSAQPSRSPSCCDLRFSPLLPLDLLPGRAWL
jgi:MFS family permease